MWTAGNKPTIADAIRDIDALVDHCNNLDNTHKPMLVKLYREYHAKGYATTQELLPLETKKGVIQGQYTSKMTGNNTLAYIRRQLKANVTQCPMCSINETHQLDHYMNEADYGQLACCRLNLVPTCGVCNRLKHDGAYSDYVHAYYDIYPNVDFLITTITVKNNRVGMTFSIDRNAIGNADLARRTVEQFTKLELTKRLHKAGIMFICEEVGKMLCTTDKELQASLAQLEMTYRAQNGRNDWRTSIVRGLRRNAAFDINVVNAMRSPMTQRPVNGGGA